MGDFVKFERFVWFDRQIRKQRYPNARNLAGHFEVSHKTAQRSIDFMRDRLIAPLEYDPSKKGYYYLDDSFELPHFQATQEEVLSVLLARSLINMSVNSKDHTLKTEYHSQLDTIADKICSSC